MRRVSAVNLWLLCRVKMGSRLRKVKRPADSHHSIVMGWAQGMARRLVEVAGCFLPSSCSKDRLAAMRLRCSVSFQEAYSAAFLSFRRPATIDSLGHLL